jgi:hypothetical protein
MPVQANGGPASAADCRTSLPAPSKYHFRIHVPTTGAPAPEQLFIRATMALSRRQLPTLKSGFSVKFVFAGRMKHSDRTARRRQSFLQAVVEFDVLSAPEGKKLRRLRPLSGSSTWACKFDISAPRWEMVRHAAAFPTFATTPVGSRPPSLQRAGCSSINIGDAVLHEVGLCADLLRPADPVAHATPKGMSLPHRATVSDRA